MTNAEISEFVKWASDTYKSVDELFLDSFSQYEKNVRPGLKQSGQRPSIENADPLFEVYDTHFAASEKELKEIEGELKTLSRLLGTIGPRDQQKIGNLAWDVSSKIEKFTEQFQTYLVNSPELATTGSVAKLEASLRGRPYHQGNLQLEAVAHVHRILSNIDCAQNNYNLKEFELPREERNINLSESVESSLKGLSTQIDALHGTFDVAEGTFTGPYMQKIDSILENANKVVALCQRAGVIEKTVAEAYYTTLDRVGDELRDDFEKGLSHETIEPPM